MPIALALITIGVILTASGLKGVSIPELLNGVVGSVLDPKGGKRETPTATLAGASSGDSFPVSGSTTSSGNSSVAAGTSSHKYSGSGGALLGRLEYIATKQFNLTISSRKRIGPAGGSWHNTNQAFDATGKASDMMAFARFVLANYGSQVEELFYDPLGGWDKGKSIGAIGGHSDHVHVAVTQHVSTD